MSDVRYLGWEGYADGQLAEALRRDKHLAITGDYHLSDNDACEFLKATPDAWDVININTPYVREVLYPGGLISVLPEALTDAVSILPGAFSRFEKPSKAHDGTFIGIPQRCGPFNMVINRRAIDAGMVRAHGPSLALENDFKYRFGVLAYDDFNVMHIAIAAGLNPFGTFDEFALSTFAAAAQRIFQSAYIVTTDHIALNNLLIGRDIDFYISGGVYTASPARRAGHSEVYAVTPSSGPIYGRGGVAFVEINAIVKHDNATSKSAEAFLDFIASDEGAFEASIAADACNPVVQMHRPKIFERFRLEHLNAMQWDDFEEDMSLCADYAIMPDYERLAAILKSERNRARGQQKF